MPKWKEFFEQKPDITHVKKGLLHECEIDGIKYQLKPAQTLIKDNRGNWYAVSVEKPLQKRLKTYVAFIYRTNSTGVKLAELIDIEGAIPDGWLLPNEVTNRGFIDGSYGYIIKTMVNTSPKEIERLKTEAMLNKKIGGFGEYLEIQRPCNRSRYTFVSCKIIATRAKGIELWKILDCGKYNFLEAINYSVAIFAALASVHSKYVLHVDPKPENIFIYVNEDRFSATFVDYGFGVECSVEKIAKIPARGDLRFIAPEVLKFDAPDPIVRVTDKTDVFSTASVIFYFLVSKDVSEIRDAITSPQSSGKSLDQRMISKISITSPFMVEADKIREYLHSKWCRDAYFRRLSAIDNAYVCLASRLKEFFSECCLYDPKGRLSAENAYKKLCEIQRYIFGMLNIQPVSYCKDGSDEASRAACTT